MKLAIIADDFTGSNDTGVQFSKKGLKTVVTTQLNKIPEPLMNADVVVFDTESRFDSKELAYKKVREMSKSLYDAHIPKLYKKLDSTFKGNIGAEIQAAKEGFNLDYVIMAPALPSNGRQTKNGHVLINGIPVNETEVANDPKTPVKFSYIPDILKMQTDLKSAVVEIPAAGYDVSAILDKIKALRNNDIEVIILDALDNEDLKVIAESIAQLDDKVLIVGTAGLAEFLPDAFQLRESLAVLSIIGSVSDVTRKQIEYAKERHDLDIYHYSFETMLDDQLNETFKAQIISALANKKHVVIQSATQMSDVSHAEKLGKGLGLTTYEVSDFIAKKMGVLTGEVMNSSKDQIGGVFITGGDTLIKIATELGVQGMEIKEEVLPAIPLGRFISDQYHHLNVVTKAGGFGSVEAFNGILKHLMNS